MDYSFTADEFNHHFISSGIKDDNISGFNPELFVSNDESFYFNITTDEEVLQTINKITSNSIGADGIPILFVKMLTPVITPYITHIINTSIALSKFPGVWKTAFVLPFPKKTNATTLNDFRPISILPSLSKILEKILKQQILRHINDNSLLHEFQSGFREQHSTTSSLLKIVDDLTYNLSSNKLSLLILLDFSKAFDSVNSTLLNKLYTEFKFSKSATLIIKSYLEKRQQVVRIDDKTSERLYIVKGVPQRSILGPILCSLFINEIITDFATNLSNSVLKLPLAQYLHTTAVFLRRKTILIRDCSHS